MPRPSRSRLSRGQQPGEQGRAHQHLPRSSRADRLHELLDGGRLGQEAGGAVLDRGDERRVVDGRGHQHDAHLGGEPLELRECLNSQTVGQSMVDEQDVGRSGRHPAPGLAEGRRRAQDREPGLLLECQGKARREHRMVVDDQHSHDF